VFAGKQPLSNRTYEHEKEMKTEEGTKLTQQVLKLIYSRKMSIGKGKREQLLTQSLCLKGRRFQGRKASRLSKGSRLTRVKGRGDGRRICDMAVGEEGWECGAREYGVRGDTTGKRLKGGGRLPNGRKKVGEPSRECCRTPHQTEGVDKERTFALSDRDVRGIE